MSPVAFLFFNRPEAVRQSFPAIRAYKPKQLLLVSDGPRANHPTDAENCNACRQIIEEMIDWECEVYRNYSPENLGCRERVSSGIDWVFENVEEAIIVEDDCVPSASFFTFCEELLTKYRDNPSVMMISGFNCLQRPQNRYSFYTARTGIIWGWATWRSRWRLYDVSMKDWPEMRDNNQLSKYIDHPLILEYWNERFDRVYNKLIDTWDYQWIYTIFKHQGVCCYPNVNLVQNVGFGAAATHTLDPKNYLSRIKPGQIKRPVTFPPTVSPQRGVDFRIFRSFFRPSLLTRIYRKIMRLF
jgi:hypothetical protein